MPTHLRSILTALVLTACLALAACGSSSYSAKPSAPSTTPSGSSSAGSGVSADACASQAGSDPSKMMICLSTHGMSLDPGKVTSCLGSSGGGSAAVDCLKNAAVSAK
jgi:hypothetical protein